MRQTFLALSLIMIAVWWLPRLAIAATWDDVEKLKNEQKFAAALEIANTVLTTAITAHDEKTWTRALIGRLQLRLGLDEFEKAVTELRTSPWPKGFLSRSTVQLYYAQSLLAYLRAYSYEISRREEITERELADLKNWSKSKIMHEALATLDAVWQERQRLGQEPIAKLGDYVQQNNYPPGIRDTLRDLLSYIISDLLADTALWSPVEANELFRVSLEQLLLTDSSQKFPHLQDSTLHPLVRLAGVLSDLEQWHAGDQRVGAAVEARLARVRVVAANYTTSEDRESLIRYLNEYLSKHQQHPWWSMGMADLAELYRRNKNLPSAYKSAEAGASAFPKSVGGRKCLAIKAEIKAPAYSLAGMQSDSVRKRSLLVDHKNLTKLYFRAYPVDLKQRLKQAHPNVLPSEREFRQLLNSGVHPTVSWTVDLPQTADLQMHQTYVTPPLEQRGLYLIAASADPEFRKENNQVLVVPLIISDLVILTRLPADAQHGLQVAVIDAKRGAPIEGAQVGLLRIEYNQKPQLRDSQTTDGQGAVLFKGQMQDYGGYAVYAELGDDIVIDTQQIYLNLHSPEMGVRSAFVYTDRSVYRPGQKLQWKVVSYRGTQAQANFTVESNAKLAVKLLDANGEVVATKEVKTNAFGSASGIFELPRSGRLLGQWHIQVATTDRMWPIQVEEYKRPTFQVSLAQPQTALRLNQTATVTGEAKYYFGQPVSGGQVRWHVKRQPVFTGWQPWRIDRHTRAAQVIASGTATVNSEGQFALAFLPAAPIKPLSPRISYNYLVEAELTDTGGETHTASRVIRLGYMTIEAELEFPVGFYMSDSSPTLQAWRRDLDGAPRAGAAKFRLVKLRQPDQTVSPADEPVTNDQPVGMPTPDAEDTNMSPIPIGDRTPGDKQKPRWYQGYNPRATMAQWNDAEEVIHGDLQHDAKGLAQIVLKTLAPGAYRLRYETTDDAGQVFALSRELIVVEKGDNQLALPAFVDFERDRVEVGDKIRTFIHSGFADQPFVWEVHRAGQLLERRILRGSELIERPVGEADRGGIVITVTAVYDHQIMQFSRTIFVPWDDRELSVEFSTFRDRLEPGANESWMITVKRRKPEGKDSAIAAAEVLAYMYDQSLDAIAPHQVPDPLSILPHRAYAGAFRTNLGSVNAMRISEYLWTERPSSPDLNGDSLQYLSDSMGGMLGRGGMMLNSTRFMVASSPQGHLPAAAARMEKSIDAGGTVAASAEAELAGKTVATPPAPLKADIPQPLRQNFAETAFFYPHLLLAKDGSVTIRFEVPEAITSWAVWAHALTKDLKSGSNMRQVKTSKDLMVRAYVPRFLREGDHAGLRVMVNNASDHELAGDLKLHLINPDSGESLDQAFELETKPRPFTVKAAGSATLEFRLKTPPRVGMIGIVAKASAKDPAGAVRGDGESRLVPVLPSRTHLVSSRFVTLKGEASKQLQFEDLARVDDPTRIDEQLVVTLDGQLFYSVLRALPYLVAYPYECSEQIFNRYFAAGLVASVYQRFPQVAKAAAALAQRQTALPPWDLRDPNRKLAIEETPWLLPARGGQSQDDTDLINLLDKDRAAAERDAALARLQKMQLSDGSFPWFPGGQPSPYITVYLALGFSRAVEMGVAIPKNMVTQTWRYLGEYFKTKIRHHAAPESAGIDNALLALLVYAWSSYPDDTWTDGALSLADRKQALETLFKDWKKLSPFSKSHLALALKRAGRVADAELVFGSILDRIKYDDERGSYLSPEDRSWLWYNDTVETAAFMLRTIGELAPGHPKESGFVQWLFLNKQLSHWKSTKATAEAIYSLVHYLGRQKSLGVREVAEVRVGERHKTFTFESDNYQGRARWILPGPELKPSVDSNILVEKMTPGMMFASATWHYSTDKLPARGESDFFTVSRRYFRRKLSQQGPLLEPLAEGDQIQVGDEVEVQLSLAAKHAAEFVHLRAPRAAGFEPTAAQSRWQWDLGIQWYEEVRDSGENFFFEWLPAGEYAFKYRVRATMPGEFRVGPATIQSMYAPEFAAYSAGDKLIVLGSELPQ